MKSYFNSQALIFPLTLYVEIELLQNSLFKFYSASTFPLTFDIFGCNCQGIGYLLNMFIDGPHICSGSIETSTISRSLKVQLILLNSNHNFLFVVFLYDLGPEKLPPNLLISEYHS